MRKHLSFVAAAATAAVFLAASPAAVAAPAESPPTIHANGLVSPLHVSAGRDGTVLVSEEFIGQLTQVNADGTKTVLYSDAAWGVAGSAQRRSTTYFAESQGAGPMDPRPLAGHIRTIAGDGTQATVGDLAALETEENADGEVHYGFSDLPDACAAQLPPEVPASYTGTVDSHPYGIALSGDTVYVADAGANSIVAVDADSGETETVAVLPPRPYVITAEVATMQQLPSCVVDHSYAFEPVPTDVAVGPDGWLYVSVLPGGPEDPALGARGAVYRVNPDNGRVRLFADDVMSPTGLALDDDGNVYVASLFGDGVLRLGCSGDQEDRQVVLSGKLTADVSIRDSRLYATVDSLPAPNQAPDGKLVSVDLDGHHH
ncbi:ScyD/ScyE family protein [Arthrobacter oryzae]|uniref:ScyD/ScyE family protein n=1 Tax=Arthrobacter oryzae TaxID=409290 RepID=UPI00285A5DE5|nr:ScyD/ScyE family protein [Arthrobacter oryzae]MDR6507501.1 glucose/arabinose dehydrogenase [Arthrobacter oryzae]